jgi:hypothetical protein
MEIKFLEEKKAFNDTWMKWIKSARFMTDNDVDDNLKANKSVLQAFINTQAEMTERSNEMESLLGRILTNNEINFGFYIGKE